eukprot:CAMPEP_0167799484 /NCGR_PEP_ID=MMETSP0111_2-20121227/17057_1 /TAXON_ID=91324 /ORGANISM="Lotharella globosa, Strain CCCM811" /LENGTH=70 /DNA_ID=CAMNT_0007694349 /DNA_START=372 /DNA_END=584 /DNA_ORIENTATION=-
MDFLRNAEQRTVLTQRLFRGEQDLDVSGMSQQVSEQCAHRPCLHVRAVDDNKALPSVESIEHVPLRGIRG